MPNDEIEVACARMGFRPRSLFVPALVASMLLTLGCSDDEADSKGAGGSAGAAPSGDAGADPTGSGGASTDERFSQSSVELDGTTGYLALGSLADIVAGDASPLTISVWTKVRGEVQSGAGIVNLKTTGGFGESIDLFWSTELEKPSVALYVPGGSVRAVVDNPAAWNHIVAVYDATAGGGSAHLYVNGVWAGSVDMATDGLELEGESEAGRYATSLYLDGYLDDLALWNAALSDGAVASIYNQGRPSDLTQAQGAYDSAAELSAYWRMGDDDGAMGTTVTDVAGENDAALEGGAVFSDDVP